MTIRGHRTISMFMRYNITSGEDQLEALKKTAAHLAAQPKKKQDGNVVEISERAEAVSE